MAVCVDSGIRRNRGERHSMEAKQAEGDRQLAAVGYLRRSTSQQEQSLDDQRSAIQQYAQEHGLHILRWYTDDAISGTRSASRKAFQAMIADAQKEDCLFSTIVVYDIKRFGRIDNDEAGHYRWILRQHGIRVAYVAEHFVGDTLDDLIRPVKQWQAREESRDLSRVTIRGLLSKVRRDLPRGAWLGGFPPHGYDLRYHTADDRFRFVVRYLRDGTKLLLDERGAETGRRPRREPHIVSKRDRCFLTPSEKVRVQTIQRIFSLFVKSRWAPTFIARRLNGDSVPTSRGPEWSARCSGLWRAVTIENILRNPAYVGDLAWNRRTLARFFRIADGGPSVRVDADLRRTTPNPEKDWIVVQNSHQPLIDRDTWLLARAGLADRTTPRKAVSLGGCR